MASVVLDQRRGIGLVDLQALRDRSRLVVVALVDVAVAAPRLAWRPRDVGSRNLVVGVPAATAEPATLEPTAKFIRRNLERKHGVKRSIQFSEHCIERLSLRERPWKPIKEELVLRTARQPFADHADHHVIGDELASVHESLGLKPKRRPVLDRLAQQVASREVQQAPLATKLLGLCALAGTRWPENDEPSYRRKPS